MENQSDINWILVAIKSFLDRELTIEESQEMLSEAFLEDKTYKLLLCGTVINDKDGDLEEMEKGYKMIKDSVEEYTYGDYGIISTHKNGELLFMPMEFTEEEISNIDNAQDISRNIDNL